MFTAVLFVAAKKLEALKCLSPDEWLNISIVKDDSAVQGKKVLACEATWLNLRDYTK